MYHILKVKMYISYESEILLLELVIYKWVYTLTEVYKVMFIVKAIIIRIRVYHL